MSKIETATLLFDCRNSDCKNKFRANIIKHKGGVNDSGWWIIKCDVCKEVFEIYIGKDVNDSSLSSGGTILERLDKEYNSVDDIKDAVKKHQN